MAEDEELQRIAKARLSHMLRSTLADRIMDQEHGIVTGLINKYRQGALKPEELFAAIGGIAELRALLGTLETDIRRG